MKALRSWLLRLRGVLSDRWREREMSEELESHFQLHVDDLQRQGMSPGDARRAARLRFGPVEAIKDELRDRATLPSIESVWLALRFAVRRLWRERGLTSVAALTLAIGVGANTAMCGLVDSLVSRPPANVRAADRVVEVESVRNYVGLEALRAHSRTLEIAAYSRSTLSLGAGAQARPVETECVTANYFSVMGPPFALGQPFPAGADAKGSARLAILSEGLWKRVFGADPNVLGRTMDLGGRQHTIVGVVAGGFHGAQSGVVEAWILLPLSPEPCSFTGANLLASSSGSWLRTIARVHDEVAIDQAAAEVTDWIRAANPGAGPVTLRTLDTPSTPTRATLRDATVASWLLAGASTLLLLACLNVAGLLAIRAIHRRRELAVRLHLGGTRARVFLQLLSEHLLLALFSAGLAALVVVALRSLLGGFFPLIGEVAGADARALVTLALLTLAAGLASGILPALYASRVDAALLLKSGRTDVHVRSWLRSALIVTQVALALVLVAEAGLFVRSVTLARSNVGYDLDRLVVATMDLARAGVRRRDEARAVFDLLLERVTQVPLVEAASLTDAPPLGTARSTRVTPTSGPGQPSTVLSSVSPDYFRTLGTPMIEGRAFTPEDRVGTTPVVIIDEVLARERWPGSSAIGRCWNESAAQACVEVVGVSARRRYGSLTGDGREVFRPLDQLKSDDPPQSLLIRVRDDARDVLPVIANAIQSASATLPFVSVRTLDELADVQTRSWRLGASMFGLFGVIAAVLSGIGLYATLAFSAQQRTTEMGVRMALGATRWEVSSLVWRHGARLSIAGAVIGLAVAPVIGRFVSGALFGVEGAGPGVLLRAGLSVAVACVLGCVLPAWRASRLDPLKALRED